MPSVGVVVLNWNGWRDTVACLASLRKQDFANLHLFVIDNGSTDDSVQEIKKIMPPVDLLETGANLGFGGGCNVGIRHAMAQGFDYIWLINSDATVNPGTLSALVRVAERHSTLGAVGSVIFEADRVEQIQLWGGGNVNLCLGRSRHRIDAGHLDFVSGASALLRCAALKDVGLFDEACFFMYWEDTDLGFRLRNAGWGLAVAENSQVWHKQSASLGKRSPLLDEYFTRSGVRFLRRYAPFPIISVSFMLSLMVAKRLIMGDWRRVRSVLKGFCEA